MSYKIAVATTDGVLVDAHFGSAASFFVIEVNEDGSLLSKEERLVPALDQSGSETISPVAYNEINTCNDQSNCGKGNGGVGTCVETQGNRSGGACGETKGGCGSGHSDLAIEAKVSLLSDCRCLLCKRIGPSAERALERKAITTFQVDHTINEALEKIIDYYKKVDNHISLRKSR